MASPHEVTRQEKRRFEPIIVDSRAAARTDEAARPALSVAALNAGPAGRDESGGLP